MDNAEQQIDHFLLPFSSDIRTLAQQLRDYLRRETKPTVEIVGDSTISVNIGYGFTEKAWDCFCAIIVYSKHINISFPSGAILDDPTGLLQGTGKRIRHLRVKDLSDVKASGVKTLLLNARNNALGKIENSNMETQKFRTIIKQISGIKKRPK